MSASASKGVRHSEDVESASFEEPTTTRGHEEFDGNPHHATDEARSAYNVSRPPLSGTLGSKQRPRWLNLSCPLEVTPRCPEAVPPASSNQSCRSG